MVKRFSILIALAAAACGQPPSALWLRGYSVVPAPRQVSLAEGDVRLGRSWRLEGSGAPIAIKFLRDDLRDFHGVTFGTGGPVVRLTVRPGAVKTGAAPEIDRQAYRLRVGDGVVEITGNGEPGLFYGVQTLSQLLRSDESGSLRAPRCTIEDWPEYQLRFLHWDTKHHQDRMETLKRFLDWAARFKANMIGLELEDKFAYPSHPVIGAPGAFTAAQLQEIVDYGLARHIQVVPEIQSPAHLAYVLKHPEFASLRADGNNYQSKMCDPRTYDLLFSMYDDAIKASKGVNYLFVSTDEVYYAGIEAECGKPFNEENRSLRWVEFVRKANDFVSSRGRKMLVWAEYPLLAKHAAMLPKGIIDGVIGEEGYLQAEKALGIRQLAYVSMQGGEYLFPSNLTAAGERGGARAGRIEEAYSSIRNGRHRRGEPIGVFGAAWDDCGLHNETFWMGWSAVANAGWNSQGMSPEEHVSSFINAYYGPRTAGIVEVYRLMQRQARAWEQSWDHEISKARGPGYGNSYGKGVGTARRDMTLQAPPLPVMPDLAFETAFAKRYAKLLAAAPERTVENDRLIHTIHENFPRAERNRYNLEVFLSLARFMGHQWKLLAAMGSAETSFESARIAAAKKNSKLAVGHLVAAYNAVRRARQDGAGTFAELQAVFEKSRYPKGRTVDGKKFIHVLDDTKDHWADRRSDLTYMTAPEESIGLKDWQAKLSQLIQAYAKANNVPVRGLDEERLEE